MPFWPSTASIECRPPQSKQDNSSGGGQPARAPGGQCSAGTPALKLSSAKHRLLTFSSYQLLTTPRYLTARSYTTPNKHASSLSYAVPSPTSSSSSAWVWFLGYYCAAFARRRTTSSFCRSALLCSVVNPRKRERSNFNWLSRSSTIRFARSSSCILQPSAYFKSSQLYTHRLPAHTPGPCLKICSTTGPISCSASSQGSLRRGLKGACHSKLPSSCSSILNNGYGRLVKLLW